MANAAAVIPFIKRWEGGLSKAKTDKASLDPVPDGTGYHTNKGITWAVWLTEFGAGKQSIKDFYAMPDNLWSKIYIKYFWSQIKGNDINSQRIADILANWAWGSGPYRPSVALQKILGVTADGVIGPQTIAKLNKANEPEVFSKLKAANIAFFDNLSKQPDYAANRTGWFNRLNDFYDNYLKSTVTTVKKNYKPIVVSLILLGVGYYVAKKYKVL